MLYPTYNEIAANWALWCEYADTGAEMEREEWESMPVTERLDLIVGCFGDETEEQ